MHIGIIGAGRMGVTHLSILGGHPGVRVSAVADNTSMVVNALKRHRPDIRLFDDYRKMLSEEQLNAVIIATPPHLHGSMIDDALNQGISIFVEKPFTLDAREANRLSFRSQTSPGTHQVGYVNRFNDVFITARTLLSNGILGRLFSFRSDMYGQTIIRPKNGSGWRAKRQTGGGCLLEFASHAVDLAVYLFGRPEKVTGSLCNSVYSMSTEDLVRTNLVYPGGMVGSIFANWSDESYRKPTNKIEVFGENGRLLADQHELKIFLRSPAEGFKKGWTTVNITSLFHSVPFYVRGNEFTRQLWHFVERAQTPELPNISSFADGAITQEVMDWVFADAGVEVPHV